MGAGAGASFLVTVARVQVQTVLVRAAELRSRALLTAALVLQSQGTAAGGTCAAQAEHF